MRKRLALAFLLFWIAASFATSFASSRDSVDLARAAFSRGRADDALRALDDALHRNSGNTAAWNLQCRVYLAQGRTDDAINSCRQAIQLAPASSEYHLWLARAYGEKASASSMVAAYKTAKLAHAEFETAVRLDGNNREALADLGQYYVEAPRILGGGCDKAEHLAQRLSALDPVRADELRARIAEAKKDFASAEQDLRANIAASQSSPEAAAQAWMDLGSFYRRRGRWNEMLAALKSGAAADTTTHGSVLVDGASTLIQAGRETALAAQWLREYLDGDALSEGAPAFVVHAQLGDLLKKQGDASAADREFAAARALSANYVETAAINTGD
jgi:tetratricopeptide (TPR) repeat protein